jgi:Tfp pilus assembly protein PilZ
MPRKEERKTILTEIILESASGKREARISDLSHGGCFVDSIVNVQVGEEVRIGLKFEDREPIHLTGRIAYVLNGVGFGVSFTELSPQSEDAIDAIVSS